MRAGRQNLSSARQELHECSRNCSQRLHFRPTVLSGIPENQKKKTTTHTVGWCHNGVRYNMILLTCSPTEIEEARKSNQSLYSQKISHISPSRAGYGCRLWGFGGTITLFRWFNHGGTCSSVVQPRTLSWSRWINCSFRLQDMALCI